MNRGSNDLEIHISFLFWKKGKFLELVRDWRTLFPSEAKKLWDVNFVQNKGLLWQVSPYSRVALGKLLAQVVNNLYGLDCILNQLNAVHILILRIYFNIPICILAHLKWSSVSLIFSKCYTYYSHLPMHTSCSAHFNPHNFVTLIIHDDDDDDDDNDNNNNNNTGRCSY
jgi:hypothetical protein